MKPQHLISSEVLGKVLIREKKTNGIFTVKSNKTGKEYTYKISRSEFNGKWYTHIKVESMYMNFKYLGSYFNGKLKKKGEYVTSPSANGIAYILKKVEEGKTTLLDTQLELMHMGNCVACGSPLTDSESIQIGLGPICNALQ